MFGRMLAYLQQHMDRVEIRERNGRRSFAFDHVLTVAGAFSILSSILDLKSV